MAKVLINGAMQAPDQGPDNPALPSYAVADPLQHKVETKVMVGLILAVLAVPGAVMPVAGLILAVAALLLVVPLRKLLQKKTLANVSVASAGLGIALSIGTFAYNLNQYNRQQAAAQATDKAAVVADDNIGHQAVAGKLIDTPCYSATAPETVNAEITTGSCTVTAYEADTVSNSRNVYKFQAIKEEELTAANLVSAGKDIAANYVTSSLPGFTITGQREGRFADSPAYYIDAKNSQDVTMQMAIVVRKVTHGENVFILMHAMNGQADLSTVAKDWGWK